MSIAVTKERVKEVLAENITDLDHVDMINEKGLYLILEGVSNGRLIFGLYLAHKTLRHGLAESYTALDNILKKIRESEDSCPELGLMGVNLVNFTDRLFIYHIKISVIEIGD